MRIEDKGLRRQDLEKCAVCGEGVMHAGNLDVYRVEVTQYIAHARNIQRETGLEMMMGGGSVGAVLASVMGDNPVLLQECSVASGLLCQTCFMGSAFGCWEKLGDATVARRERQEANSG